MSLGELRVNPPAVASVNSVTPVKKPDLQPFEHISLVSEEHTVAAAERTVKLVSDGQVYAEHHLLWIKI